MLTAEGIALLWSLAAGTSEDTIPGWSIAVGDGTVESRAAIAAPVVTQTDDGAEVLLMATFTEDEANHDWTTRSVVSGGGVVVDVEVEDMGRKAQGSESTIQVVLELAPTSAGE